MNLREESLKKHYEWNGKLEIALRCPVETSLDLSLAYTPGVAEPCLAIQKDPAASFLLTRRNNMVAVVTDGSAVLGLGNIGPEAGMPVMEGKCVLFKRFGGVDAVPLCIRSNEPDDIVNTVALIAGSFGGINLEDISAPRCFEVEEKLKKRCDIPVFHDDQHGTAVVVTAALINALKLVGKSFSELTVVINGLGAAGTAIAKMIDGIGVRDMLLLNSRGIADENDPRLGEARKALVQRSNRSHRTGGLAEAMKGADVFIGVSAPGIVSADMIRSMNHDAIVFAMANPTPEIMPDEAKKAGARVVGTGRSDFPNQINNVLAFPGIFRGALDSGAKEINEPMKQAAAKALASLVSADELSDEHVIPSALDERVAAAVSAAVAKAARESGVTRGA